MEGMSEDDVCCRSFPACDHQPSHPVLDTTLTVKFALNTVNIHCSSTENVATIKDRLSSITGVALDGMKLVVKGKILTDESSVKDLWVGGAQVKVAMIGTKLADVLPSGPPDDLERIRDDLSGRPHANKRVKLKTSSRGRLENSPYKFGRLETLSGFSDSYKAQQILEQLSTDPAILSVLAKHKWSVGALCEMFPEGYVGVSNVCVMGLNQNRGEKILLRLRTDDLKGFRKILSIRKVLYHELAHNVYSDHDDNFYRLMRQVEMEVNEEDWSVNGKGRVLDKSFERYQGTNSSQAMAAASQVYRLGGNEDIARVLRPAEIAGLAAALRLTPEEREVEGGCGCLAGLPVSNTALERSQDSLLSNVSSVIIEEATATDSCTADAGKNNDVNNEILNSDEQAEEIKETLNCTETPSEAAIASPLLLPPPRPMHHKSFADFRSRILWICSDVMNDAVSFEQAHTLNGLEILRDSILTFLASCHRDDPAYVLSEVEYNQLHESLLLIETIATKAKV